MTTFNKKRISEEQFEKYIIDDASINLAKEIAYENTIDEQSILKKVFTDDGELGSHSPIYDIDNNGQEVYGYQKSDLASKIVRYDIDTRYGESSYVLWPFEIALEVKFSNEEKSEMISIVSKEFAKTENKHVLELLNFATVKNTNIISSNLSNFNYLIQRMESKIEDIKEINTLLFPTSLLEIMIEKFPEMNLINYDDSLGSSVYLLPDKEYSRITAIRQNFTVLPAGPLGYVVYKEIYMALSSPDFCYRFIY